MAISAPPPTQEPVMKAIVGLGNDASASSAARVAAE
jgi:hypothetical protein